MTLIRRSITRLAPQVLRWWRGGFAATADAAHPYDAFVSYKHAVSSAFASDFELQLKRYGRGPLAWPRSVFRDEQYVVPGDELPVMIERALRGSRYLILLASPEAAASPWVQSEIDIWCGTLERTDSLIIVLTAGTIGVDTAAGQIDWSATDALPPNLTGYLSGLPLWCDLSDASDPSLRSMDNPTFKAGLNAIVAKMESKSPNALLGEEWRLRRRTVRIVAAAIVVLVALFAGVVASLVVLERRNDELGQSLAVSHSRELAAASQLEPLPASIGMAARAVRTATTIEAKRTLRRNMAAVASLRGHLAQTEDAIETMALAPGGGAMLYAPAGPGQIGATGLEGSVLPGIALADDSPVREIVRDGDRLLVRTADAVWLIPDSTTLPQRMAVDFELYGSGMAPTAMALDGDRMVLGWPTGRLSVHALVEEQHALLYRHQGMVEQVAVVGSSIVSAATSADDPLVVLTPGQDPAVLTRAPGAVNAFRVSKTGKRIAIVFELPWVGVWSFPMLERLWLEETTTSNHSVAFLGTGDGTIAAGDADGTIRLWDARGVLDDQISASGAGIFALQSDRGRLYSAGSDGWLRVWRPYGIGAVSTPLPDAATVFWHGDVLWGLHKTGGWRKGPGPAQQFKQEFSEILDAAAKSVVVSAGEHPHLLRLSPESASIQYAYPAAMPEHRLHRAAISPDGLVVALIWWPRDWNAEKANIMVWHWGEERVIALDVPVRAPRALAFAGPARIVAVGDTEMAAWRVADGALLDGSAVRLGNDPITEVAATPAGRVVLGGLDGHLQVRTLEEPGAVLARRAGTGGAIQDLSVVPDGRILAVDYDGLHLFDEGLAYLGPLINQRDKPRLVRTGRADAAGARVAVTVQGGRAALVPLVIAPWVAAAEVRTAWPGPDAAITEQGR